MDRDICFISAQTLRRRAKASMLRAYDCRSKTSTNEWYSLGFSLPRLLTGRINKKELRDSILFKDLIPFTFYFPGAVSCNRIDSFLSKLWVKSHVIKIRKRFPRKTHFVIEAGVGSLVLLELLKSDEFISGLWTFHYRINDKTSAFRKTEVIEIAHKGILEFDHSGLKCSAPVASRGKGEYEQIMPGVSESILNADISDQYSADKNKTIVYPGVYPISTAVLETMSETLGDYRIVYTGPKSYESDRVESLGYIESSEVDLLVIQASVGVMIFPNDEYDWYCCSNKMLVYRTLGLPIIGNHPYEVDLKKYGVVSLYDPALAEYVGKRQEPIESYDWNEFYKLLITVEAK